MFRKGYILFSLVLVFVSSIASFSQGRNRNHPGRNKGSRVIDCPIFIKDKYPYQGIGFKVGDPFALTYKFYFNEHFAITLDGGKASSGLYSRYFREKFSEYVLLDTISDDSEIDFLTHKVKADWVGALKLVWHFDAKGITPGLRFYLGAGIQTKYTKLQYQYLYTADPGNGNSNAIGSFSRKYTAIGPLFSLGIEYSYFQAPISAFMELELFRDVKFDPGNNRFGGGAGLRYVF